MTCYVYVFPCVWEDHCKVGFSRDPLARIAQLHCRWFAFFDLQSAYLVETEREREARDLELWLRRPLAAHRAPQPLTIRDAAGGHTEWLRGAGDALRAQATVLRSRGYLVHAPFAYWARRTLATQCGALYHWTQAQLSPDELEGRIARSAAQSRVRDTLDACQALDIAVEAMLPRAVWRWYRNGCHADRPAPVARLTPRSAR